MKIALFSDIHANFPALQAVLADIDSRDPDLIYCLGDLVGYAPYPNEVINEIRKRKIPTIAGNYDEGIGLTSDNCGCAYKAEEEKSNGAISIAFTNQIIKPEERAYLKNLPRHFALDFEHNGEKFKFLMVHGSPRKINEYLFEDRDEESLMRIMEHGHADIMAFGHTHKPYHRILQNTVEKRNPDTIGKRETFRHAINIGSVGKPKDGDNRACYVILDINSDTSMTNPDSIKVEFVRVAYDFETIAQAIEKTILPNEYADMLRKAY
jgi:predicted phosphodiesterase